MKQADKHIIKLAIGRFSDVVNSLECECSEEHTCSIHRDRRLAEQATKVLEGYCGVKEDAE